jgi:hypothetical protein
MHKTCAALHPPQDMPSQHPNKGSCRCDSCPLLLLPYCQSMQIQACSCLLDTLRNSLAIPLT